MDASWLSFFVTPFAIYFVYRFVLLLSQIIVHNKFKEGIKIEFVTLLYVFKLLFDFRNVSKSFFENFFLSSWGILAFKILLICILFFVMLTLWKSPFWNPHVLLLVVLFSIGWTMGFLNEVIYLIYNWFDMYENEQWYNILLPFGTMKFWNETTLAFVIAFLIYGVYTYFLTVQVNFMVFFAICFIVTTAFVLVFIVLRKFESFIHNKIFSLVSSDTKDLNPWGELLKILKTGNDFKMKEDIYHIVGRLALVGFIAFVITWITNQVMYPNKDQNDTKDGPEVDVTESETEKDVMKRFAIGIYIILFIGISITLSLSKFGSTKQ